jgi:hypothetical protein
MRLGFCLAVAVIAAAIADPIVEYASNAGCFGAGNFTDHSTLDVVPALLAGVALFGCYLVRRARALVADRGSERLSGLLPTALALQMLVLYVMETSEQLVVWHHTLGPTVWLGAPAPISIALHALVCVGVVLAMRRSRRALAATTLRVIALIQAIATLPVKLEKPLPAHRAAPLQIKVLLPVLSAVGVRAPPVTAL